MREIKFRSWDGGKILSHEEIYIYNGSLCHKGEYDHIGVCNGVLMQFTGLRDKNGKEIYEGDLVKDHVGIGEVKYADNKAAFRVCYGDGMAKWFIDYSLKGERASIEILGNVYENPELLEAIHEIRNVNVPARTRQRIP